jgi:hypothetical protein
MAKKKRVEEGEGGGRGEGVCYLRSVRRRMRERREGIRGGWKEPTNNVLGFNCMCIVLVHGG